MRLVSELRERLRALLFRGREDRDLEDELAFHVEQTIEENLRRGLGSEEARRQAAFALGGLDRTKEEVRDARGTRPLEDFVRDLREAARWLRRSPAFALAALITLALGIGASTAVFSVVNGVLIRPLPYPEPDRLAYLTWDWGRGGGAVLSPPKYAFWKENARSFAGISTFRSTPALFGEGTESAELQGQRVDDDFFRVFGVGPALGRMFTADEYLAEEVGAVIISHEVWQTYLGGQRDVLGRRIMLEGTSYSIIGVMPPEFRLLESSGVDFILPFSVPVDWQDEGHNYLVVARLADGVTEDVARAELASLTTRFRRVHPSLVDSDRERMTFSNYSSLFVGDLRKVLFILLGAVGFVLLIACANVANLLLVRSADRRREIAIRVAIGADRRRVLAQLLTESIALALLAGVGGMLIGIWTVDALLAFMPDTLPRVDEIGLDARVLGFALAAATVTGIAVGLAAAVPVVRGDLTAFLKEGDRAGSRGPAARRLRALLVIGQTAVASVLLAGAALLIASFSRLRAVDPGFDATGIVAVSFGRVPASHDDAALWRFQQTAIERLRNLSSVQMVASAANLPLERGMNIPVTVVGRPDASEGAVEWRAVSPGYFELLDIPLVRGRFFTGVDDTGGPRTVLVNESYARHYFPDGNALGQQIAIGWYQGNPLPGLSEPPRTIVGVVRDVKEIGLDAPPRRTVFVPQAQVAGIPWGPPHFLLRTGQPTRAVSEARRVFRDTDPRMPAPEFRSLTEIVGASIKGQRFSTLLMTVFAGLALALTTVGLYGVLSYAVRQRTREVGIRMALGARRTHILGMVLRQGLGLTLAGLAIGLIAAIALTQLLTTMLFDVQPTDPVYYVAVATLLTTVAALASYIPARRATRVAPMVTLRGE